ncbi:MAG TPA: hypothetical protein VJC14_01175 [Candidatus Paceibacterota bacterium]
MNKKIITSLIIIVVLIGGAYWLISKEKLNTNTTSQMPIVTSGENPEPGSEVHNLPVEPAADVARKDLALKLSVDEKSIVIMKITEMTWSDGCLGLGGPAESCLQALVPGFKVEMLAKGETYFYRTDKTGATVRAETQ